MVTQKVYKLPLRTTLEMENSLRQHAGSSRCPSGFQIDLENCRIKLPQLGWLSIWNKLEITGVAKEATLSEHFGCWYLSLLTEQEITPPEKNTDDQNGTARGSKSKNITPLIIMLALITGLVGSAMSYLGICTGSDACSDASRYTLFGTSFASTGILFFAAMIVLYLYCRRKPAELIFNSLASAAAGAEMYFLFIQQTEIGHFCPICMIIAAAVMLLCLPRCSTLIADICEGIRISYRHLAQTLLLVFFGFLIARAGTGFPPPVIPETTAVRQPSVTLGDLDIWSGNRNSNVEVYIVSDFYCPFCRQIEGKLEKIAAIVAPTARYTYIDLPLHKSTPLLLSYHNSLLLKNKEHYQAGRKALMEATGESSTPGEQEIVAAYRKHGVTHQAGDESLLKEIQGAATLFLYKAGVHATPAIVVFNRQTYQRRVLTGIDEINTANVLTAIKECDGVR